MLTAPLILLRPFNINCLATASTQDTPTVVNSSGILRFRPFRTSHFHEFVYRSTTPLLCPTQLRAINTSKSGVSGDWDFYIGLPAPLLPDREDSPILIDPLLVNLLSCLRPTLPIQPPLVNLTGNYILSSTFPAPGEHCVYTETFRLMRVLSEWASGPKVSFIQ